MFAGNPEINPKVQAAIRASGIDPLNFVLWLLYAYSPKGDGIKNPAMFALRRVYGEKAAEPPAELQPFAALSPDELRRMLDYPASGSPYERLLPSLPPKRQELRNRLFPSLSINPRKKSEMVIKE